MESIAISLAKARLSMLPICSQEFLHTHSKILAKVFYGSSIHHYVTRIILAGIHDPTSVLVHIRHSYGLASHGFMHSVYIIITIQFGNSWSL